MFPSLESVGKCLLARILDYAEVQVEIAKLVIGLVRLAMIPSNSKKISIEM